MGHLDFIRLAKVGFPEPIDLKKKFSVAIYTGRIPATTFIERLVEGLAASGIEVCLFGEVASPLRYASSNIRVVGWRGRYERLWMLLKYFPLLLFRYPNDLRCLLVLLPPKSLKEKLWCLSKYLPVLWLRPDIFHIQWAKSLAEWSWIQRFGMKLVLSLRGAHINYSPIADASLAENYKRLFPRVDGFHAVSGAIKEEAQQYGAPAERICVVYSGLDLKQFPFKPSKQIQQPLKMISVGRAHWKKGYAYALDACRLLRDLQVDFEYRIIGGRTEEYLFQVHQLGLENWVELMDALPFETVQRLITEADVLLLPSVEEGIANVVLEAMALGTPVISTDCGGMAEVIEGGVNGFLVPVRNAAALAAAVMRFTALTEDGRLKMIRAARKTVEESFSVEQMVHGMVQLYEEVISPAPISCLEEIHQQD